MPRPESSSGEHEPELGGAERLLATIMSDLDPQSFTLEEITDYYTPLTIEEDQEEVDGVEEYPEDITQEQLTTLLDRGFIEQHGDYFSVTDSGRRFYEDHGLEEENDEYLKAQEDHDEENLY